MENPKKQLIDKLKDANNVLVTVSSSPTVDQLCAAIGLTLFLTKMKKHATTVFSGEIPSTIDFLKPEDTIEANTDSLRDFIISLDKSKADKIRYKVEDTMVKIFITPYRSSITDEDLIFSQGDFNVDVVVGIGVQVRDDIDQAIMANGRILHDATVATVNVTEKSDLGTLNWSDTEASSLCEMIVGVTDQLKTNSLDGQMATALLTGIVAETDRFSNDKTSSNTMNASAKLMAAGANQQLVATQLEALEEIDSTKENIEDNEEAHDSGLRASKNETQDSYTDDDGSLRIHHKEERDEHKDEDTAKTVEPWSPELDLPEIPEFADENEDRPANINDETNDESTLEAQKSDEAPKVNNEAAETQAKIQTDNKPSVGQPSLTDKIGANSSGSYNESNPFNFPEIKRPILRRGNEKSPIDEENNSVESADDTKENLKDEESASKEADDNVGNFLKHRISRRYENNTFDKKVIPSSEKHSKSENVTSSFIPRPLNEDLIPNVGASDQRNDNKTPQVIEKQQKQVREKEELSSAQEQSGENVSKLPESFVQSLNKTSLEAIEKKVGAKKEHEVIPERENTEQKSLQEKAKKPVIDDVTNKSIDQIERAMADLKKKQSEEKTVDATMSSDRPQAANRQVSEKQETNNSNMQDEARDAVLRAIGTTDDNQQLMSPKQVSDLASSSNKIQAPGAAPEVPPPVPSIIETQHKGPSPYIDIDSQTGILTPLSPDSVTNGDFMNSPPPMVPPPISNNSNV